MVIEVMIRKGKDVVAIANGNSTLFVTRTSLTSHVKIFIRLLIMMHPTM